MLATSPARGRKRLTGSPLPRIAPPVPVRHGGKAFAETASGMGITLMPWQHTAARYLTATGPNGTHLYREVCIVVARQQGKTTLGKPLIIRALRAGLKVMHIAQTRELPRHMFGVVADALSDEPDLFPRRRGKVVWPRYGAGQEEIVLANGGSYRIAAATTGGPRGWANDLVIIDELREMDSTDVIGAVEPTLTMSADPLTVYFSNAGHERSVVLNSLRARQEDPSLAYLEWSAAPDRAPDDHAGWLESCPAIGHFPQVLPEIERSYVAHKLAGTMPLFETERLCRWVVSMDRRYVEGWDDLPRGDVPNPLRTWMGMSVDTTGERASAVLAWPSADGTVNVSVVADVTGNPVDIDRFGEDLRHLANDRRVVETAYDPWTDADLARYLPRARALNGREYANASAKFVERVEARGLRIDDEAELLSADLGRLTRRSTQAGSYMAVRANEQESATAALAAIRAVWLATAPGPSGIARIY